MASIHFNPHLPESCARVVLRRVGDKVFFTRPPLHEGPPTPANLRRQQIFAESAAYTRGIYNLAVRRAPYEDEAKAKKKPLFSFIMTGFLRDPIIKSVELGGYHGHVGDELVVRTRSDLPLASIEVALRRADGTEVESGSCAGGTADWRYAATVAVAAGSALTLHLTVKDDDGIEVARTLPVIVA